VDEVRLQSRVHAKGILVDGDDRVEGPRLRALRDDQLSAPSPRLRSSTQQVFLRNSLRPHKERQECEDTPKKRTA
jgi:hypothetical protein